MSRHLVCFLAALAPALLRADTVEPPLVGTKRASSANSVRYSPDGKRIAVAYSDGTILLSDARWGELVHTCDSGKGPAFSLAFSPDGQHVVSAHIDDAVVVWDVATGKKVTEWTRNITTDPPVFSPDGKTLYLGTERGTIRSFEFPSGKPREDVALSRHYGPVRAIGITPDGKTVISGGADGRLVFWDVAANKEMAVVDLHQMGPIKSLVISPKGESIGIGFTHNTILLMETATRKMQILWNQEPGSLLDLAFSANGRFLVAAGQVSSSGKQHGFLWRYDTQFGQASGLRDLGKFGLMSVALSPTRHELATANTNGDVWLWTGDEDDPFAKLRRAVPQRLAFVGPPLPEWHTSTVLSGRSSAVLAVAFSPDGRTLASGGADGWVSVWNPATSLQAADVHHHDGEVRALTFSPNGRLLISGGLDRVVKVRDLKEQRTTTLAGFRGVVLSLAISGDGGTLAVGVSDGNVHLWNLKTYELLAIVTAHARPVYAMAFSRAGRTLATGSSDGLVRLWDLARGEARAVLEHPDPVRALAFGRDDATMVTASSEGALRVWDLASTEVLTTRQVRKELICGLALNPRDDSLATASLGKLINIWNDERVLSLESFSNSARCVAFAPDGFALASGSDRGVILWTYGVSER